LVIETFRRQADITRLPRQTSTELRWRAGLWRAGPGEHCGTARRWGFPFWLAGGYGNPEKLRENPRTGCSGHTGGTALRLAASRECGPIWKTGLNSPSDSGNRRGIYRSCGFATGFRSRFAHSKAPLRLFNIYRQRKRVWAIWAICARLYPSGGKIAYRCSAEPVEELPAKGGKIEDTVGPASALQLSDGHIGHQQTRKDGYV